MRVLLFGIDGLTFRILHPMMERGLLPNFQRVRDEGVQGTLRSTTPPMTPPAWMSISTGLSLAKHGVYDFWEYEQTDSGPRARVMTHRDAPEVDVLFVETRDRYGPFGAKTLGEPPIIPSVAAIANAIFNAIGKRIKDLPITREKLIGALA